MTSGSAFEHRWSIPASIGIVAAVLLVEVVAASASQSAPSARNGGEDMSKRRIGGDKPASFHSSRIWTKSRRRVAIAWATVGGAPLSPGRNVLAISVDGALPDGRTATDRDRLTFVVG
jgi:hypothetical protein